MESVARSLAHGASRVRARVPSGARAVVLFGFLRGAIAVAAILAAPPGFAEVCVGPALPLNTNAAIDAGADLDPALATNGAGDWLAVWSSSDDLGGTVGTDRDILYSRSTDAGGSWSPPANLVPYMLTDSGTDDGARIAFTGSAAGAAVAVWSTTTNVTGLKGPDRDIVGSRWNPASGAWSSTFLVNSSAIGDLGADFEPDLACDGAGACVVVWTSTENLGGTLGADEDLLFARTTNDGASWSAAAPLHATMAGDSRLDVSPRVAADANGRLVVVWAARDPSGGGLGSDFDALFSRSFDGGVTWSAPAPLNPAADSDAGSDTEPFVAQAGGVWLAAWSSTDDLAGGTRADEDLLFARSTDFGLNWSPPAPLNANAATDLGGDFAPRLVPERADRADNWSAVWISGDPLDFTLGFDLDLFVAGSGDAGLTWSAPRALDADAATDAAIDGPPAVATDGANRWVVAWHSDRAAATQGADHDVFVARTPPLALILEEAIDFTVVGTDGGSWIGGVALGVATTSVNSEGLCLAVPLAGDNLALWISPERYLELTDRTVWRVRAEVSTDQAAPDAIPFWQIVYDNFQSGGGGNNIGGESWFLDAERGANGIGRPQGRDVFEIWIAPNAMLLPQWRGIVDPSDSAFSVAADSVNDLRMFFRVLDVESAPLNAGLDAGTICFRSVRVEAADYDSLPCPVLRHGPPISNATFAAQTNSQAAQGAGSAVIDDAGARADYSLTASGPGARKTLIPASLPYDLPALYPVPWKTDTLYRGEATIVSAVAGPEGDDPPDVISLAFDTTNSELGQVHATTRGAPNNMRKAASPRLPASVGGEPQIYVGFFHGQNRTWSETPEAARLRMQTDFQNTPEVGSEGAGADPFSVLRAEVREHSAIPGP